MVTREHRDDSDDADDTEGSSYHRPRHRPRRRRRRRRHPTPSHATRLGTSPDRFTPEADATIAGELKVAIDLINPSNQSIGRILTRRGIPLRQTKGKRASSSSFHLAHRIYLPPSSAPAMSDKDTSTLQSVLDKASGAAQSLLGSLTGNDADKVR